MDEKYKMPEFTDKTRRAKDDRTRIKSYETYLQETKSSWAKPDLNKYAIHLSNRGLKKTTIAGYVSTVKRHYRRLLKMPSLEKKIKRIVPPTADSELYIRDAIAAIQAATHRSTAQVTVERETKLDHISHKELSDLFSRINLENKTKLRDVLMIATILFTGISEVELTELNRKNIYRKDGQLWLDVPYVSGGQERSIPFQEHLFFDQEWYETFLDYWVSIAPIENGVIFRGFYRGGTTIRKNRLRPNAVHEILSRYIHDGEQINVMDLRRLFTRRAYDNGVSVETLKDWTGYKQQRSVVNQIGLPDPKGELGTDQRMSGMAMLDALRRVKEGRLW